MKTPKTIEIGSKRYLWREILALRKAQIEAARRVQQPALFELHDDRRPAAERTAADRYAEPSLFTLITNQKEETP